MSRIVKTLSNGQDVALTRTEQRLINLVADPKNRLMGAWTGHNVYQYILFMPDTVNAGSYEVVNSDMATALNRNHLLEVTDSKYAGHRFVLSKWGKELITKPRPERLDPTIRRIVHDI